MTTLGLLLLFGETRPAAPLFLLIFGLQSEVLLNVLRVMPEAKATLLIIIECQVLRLIQEKALPTPS